MLVFIVAVIVAAAGVGFLVGFVAGINQPIDPRRDVDALARRDRTVVR